MAVPVVVDNEAGTAVASDLFDRLAVLPQYVWPQRLLAVLGGRVAAARAGWWVRWVVPLVRLSLWREHGRGGRSRPDGYACFNDFFTRALRDGVRPLAQSDFVCPVDAAVIHCGTIMDGQLLQAKGHRYSVQALVGGDSALANLFNDGPYASLYLSPKDYYRIHMPCDGRLVRMIHVPGHLFSVNPATVRGVPGLLARNERVVCVFESAWGPFVMVLVGATIVGSIATVWHGVVNPPRPASPREWRYDDQTVTLRRGEEMGRFLLGSTVIALFPTNVLRLREDWVPAHSVRMGESMGVSLVR